MLINNMGYNNNNNNNNTSYNHKSFSSYDTFLPSSKIPAVFSHSLKT
jgi:hypothetical protein